METELGTVEFSILLCEIKSEGINIVVSVLATSKLGLVLGNDPKIGETSKMSSRSLVAINRPSRISSTNAPPIGQVDRGRWCPVADRLARLPGCSVIR